MALLSFVAGTVNLQLPFVVTDPYGDLLTNATSATVTWLAEDGRSRPLTLVGATSAVFAYTLSASDYPGPRYERGQLRVSIGVSVYWLPVFTLAATPSLL